MPYPKHCRALQNDPNTIKPYKKHHSAAEFSELKDPFLNRIWWLGYNCRAETLDDTATDVASDENIEGPTRHCFFCAWVLPTCFFLPFNVWRALLRPFLSPMLHEQYHYVRNKPRRMFDACLRNKITMYANWLLYNNSNHVTGTIWPYCYPDC